MRDLDSVAGELYGLDPGDFVSARSECAAQARRAGNRELTAAIGRLRKPTVAAWMVNLLARERGDELAALLDLGDSLRAAQRRLSGSDMRALSAQRRRIVTALERAAADLADERGRHATESALREVGQTLNAALADPDVAEAVRAGRLASIVEHSGFGDLSSVPLTLVPDAAQSDEDERTEPERSTAGGTRASGGRTERDPGRRRADKGKADKTEREGAERDRAERDRAERDRAARDARQAEIDEAAAEAESARAAVEQARSSSGDADAELERFEQEVVELRRKLEHAEQQRQFARRAVARAKKEITSAERAASAAEAKLVRLRNSAR